MPPLINHIAARPAFIGRGIYQTCLRTVPEARANQSRKRAQSQTTDH
jgi:hypothetical protein